MSSSLFVQDRKGRKWPIKFEIRRNCICYLTEGWSEFWDAHHIKGGDFICFKFDNKDTLKCRIYCRCTKEAGDYESDGRHLVNPHPLAFPKKETAQHPKPAKAKITFSRTSVASSQVGEQQSLYYMAGQQHSKSWEVNCINEIGHFIGFSGGWGTFVRDNGLKVGDCCVFEVIADRKMRISIFPFK
ncbi:hypothetical protein COLO4_16889 [Corchorus olitorius]|uniref:TF-B3 domain-containing protein n=1 Tax=Corchorus olitorius TaxID=93759 RepID=A0A1R3JF49_9ROSI|nr:hypothetical protein COLO4_16889 [Corchorus olitorius]